MGYGIWMAIGFNNKDHIYNIYIHYIHTHTLVYIYEVKFNSSSFSIYTGYCTTLCGHYKPR